MGSDNIEYIPKEELEIGATYLCKARNFTEGRWDGERFAYQRRKFSWVFTDHEYHWDDGPPFGTVKPLKKLEQK